MELMEIELPHTVNRFVQFQAIMPIIQQKHAKLHVHLDLSKIKLECV